MTASDGIFSGVFSASHHGGPSPPWVTAAPKVDATTTDEVDVEDQAGRRHGEVHFHEGQMIQKLGGSFLISDVCMPPIAGGYNPSKQRIGVENRHA